MLVELVKQAAQTRVSMSETVRNADSSSISQAHRKVLDINDPSKKVNNITPWQRGRKPPSMSKKPSKPSTFNWEEIRSRIFPKQSQDGSLSSALGRYSTVAKQREATRDFYQPSYIDPRHNSMTVTDGGRVMNNPLLERQPNESWFRHKMRNWASEGESANDALKNDRFRATSQLAGSTANYVMAGGALKGGLAGLNAARAAGKGWLGQTAGTAGGAAGGAYATGIRNPASSFTGQLGAGMAHELGRQTIDRSNVGVYEPVTLGRSLRGIVGMGADALMDAHDASSENQRNFDRLMNRGMINDARTIYPDLASRWKRRRQMGF